jgi:hypothetical protein
MRALEAGRDQLDSRVTAVEEQIRTLQGRQKQLSGEISNLGRAINDLDRAIRERATRPAPTSQVGEPARGEGPVAAILDFGRSWLQASDRRAADADRQISESVHGRPGASRSGEGGETVMAMLNLGNGGSSSQYKQQEQDADSAERLFRERGGVVESMTGGSEA